MGQLPPLPPASAGSEYFQKDIESTSAPLKQKEHFEQNLSSANFVVVSFLKLASWYDMYYFSPYIFTWLGFFIYFSPFLYSSYSTIAFLCIYLKKSNILDTQKVNMYILSKKYLK